MRYKAHKSFAILSAITALKKIFKKPTVFWMIPTALTTCWTALCPPAFSQEWEAGTTKLRRYARIKISPSTNTPRSQTPCFRQFWMLYAEYAATKNIQFIGEIIWDLYVDVGICSQISLIQTIRNIMFIQTVEKHWRTDYGLNLKKRGGYIF